MLEGKLVMYTPEEVYDLAMGAHELLLNTSIFAGKGQMRDSILVKFYEDEIQKCLDIAEVLIASLPWVQGGGAEKLEATTAAITNLNGKRVFWEVSLANQPD